ncbi:MAG: AMP-binding protein, partial [Pseudomonadales bacterium]|nr:AMP-binding protein [Pseudomonadales bacterium]
MTELLYELPLRSAARFAERPALRFKDQTIAYGTLAADIDRFAAALLALGIGKQERVAVFLPKQPETVVTIFGAARAGCVFVPVNSVLKPAQVAHILRDCNVKILVTSPERARDLVAVFAECPDLRHLVLVGADRTSASFASLNVVSWTDLPTTARASHRVIDTDVVSIFYTSGSTGKPKGVVLSNRNVIESA